MKIGWFFSKLDPYFSFSSIRTATVRRCPAIKNTQSTIWFHSLCDWLGSLGTLTAESGSKCVCVCVCELLEMIIVDLNLHLMACTLDSMGDFFRGRNEDPDENYSAWINTILLSGHWWTTGGNNKRQPHRCWRLLRPFWQHLEEIKLQCQR